MFFRQAYDLPVLVLLIDPDLFNKGQYLQNLFLHLFLVSESGPWVSSRMEIRLFVLSVLLLGPQKLLRAACGTCQEVNWKSTLFGQNAKLSSDQILFRAIPLKVSGEVDHT